MARKPKNENQPPTATQQNSTVTLPEPGDLVDVHIRIKEGDKERIQIFRGTVIAVRGKGASKTFTVRRVSRGVGIERIFPINAPVIAKVDIRRKSKVRRAKLYYLRKKRGQEAVLKERKPGEKSRPQTVAQ
ncbi:MAG: 50S ribosomal protein L19 [candidate division WOR-3 bacterium]|jgi:large subunit ribosomal protein L19|nr:50S ribosomal protein L19 [candidate division WOR-3 bacterium]MCR4423567.1 50S ribosomal protein L19 [candidate division WOR-3 bacterium]MDH7518906.1 50S ribosomal protein L19 [bacterium]